MSACAHPVASMYANAYADVHKTCLTYTPAHAWCSQTGGNACILSPKMHMHSCMRAYAMVKKLLCRKSYCELVLSLAQASCRLSIAARPTTVSTKPVARRLSLKKSVQIHSSSWRSRRCGVAQASFNHPRWCRPHPVCLWVALALGRGAHLIKILLSPSFRETFQTWSWRGKPAASTQTRVREEIAICFS